MKLNADFSLLCGEIELDEARFGGRRKGKSSRSAAGNVPVGGIMVRGGRDHVRVVPDDTAVTLLRRSSRKFAEAVSSFIQVFAPE